MDSSTKLTVFPIMLVLAILLAILSVTAAFCRTEKSTDYKNKVNISKKNYIIIYPTFFALNLSSMLLSFISYSTEAFNLFSVGFTAAVFAIQAVIIYLTLFKKFQCNTGTKVSKAIVFSLISTPYYNMFLSQHLLPSNILIPIPIIIGLFIYCITSYR